MCSPGFTGAGHDACVKCAAGTYKTLPGAAVCTECAAGTYSATEGAAVAAACASCPAGKVSVAGASTCGACPAGMSAVTAGSCTACPAGTSSALGDVACTSCAAGTYSATEGALLCTPCAAGKFSVWAGLTGAAECGDCAAGTYSALTGRTSCAPCAAGTFSGAGALLCTPCAAGTFSALRARTSAAACAACAAGTYSAAAAAVCTPCPAGTFSALPGRSGATDCTACAAGKFASPGASNCTLCGAGKYSLAAAGSCSPCPLGTSSAASGASACSACAPGFARAEPGGGCACAPGTFLLLGACQACPPGSVKPGVGDGACAPCEAPLVPANNACVCPANTQARASQQQTGNASFQEGPCEACAADEYALPGAACACPPGTVRAELDAATASSPERNATRSPCVPRPAPRDGACVVNRRLPPFAFRLGRRAPEGAQPPGAGQRRDAPPLAAGFGSAPPPSASRSPGGACHMGRLPRVAAAALRSNLSHALQLCAPASGGAARLACAALAQDPAQPAASRSVLSFFELTPPEAGRARALDEPHARRSRCAACDGQELAGVVPRFANAPPQAMRADAPRQLSVGEPVRLSPERVVAASLRRALCADDDPSFGTASAPPGHDHPEGNCSALARAAPAADFRRGHLLRALLAAGAPAEVNDDAATRAALEAERALWERPWVFCPAGAPSAGSPSQASSSREPGACRGSVPRATWLDAARRPGACAEQLASAPSEYKAPVHFCLLNADTERLCQAMPEWRAEVREILCRAAGVCPRSDFFYTPTTFDLASQEFVFDSVRRYYTQDAGGTCADPLQKEDLLSEQLAANAAAVARCASAAVQPLYDAVVGARAAKRRIALIYYHAYRALARLVQLLAALVLDSGAVAGIASGGDSAGDMGGAVAAAATRLAQSCVALVESIGSVFEAAEQAVLELFMSRGIGGWLRELLTWLCEIAKFVVNNLWVPILCPIADFVFDMARAWVSFLEAFYNGLRNIGIPIPGVQELIKIFQDVLAAVAPEDCRSQTIDRPCVPAPKDSVLPEDAALAVGTRCWGTYVTFFGDHQQLSCTAADTCRAGRLQPGRVVCAACPPPAPGVLAFACDEITKLCTCGVPQRHDTQCAANEDCELADASCRVLSGGLELSGADIPCSSCSSAPVCFHAAAGSPGLCACAAGFRDNLQRCARPAVYGADYAGIATAFLFLEIDRLCLWHSAPAGPDADVVEFRAASVIPCVHLDPSAATCTYAIDIGLHVVRGGQGAAGAYGPARRLLAAPEDHERFFAPAGAVWSRDPLCRDALRSPALAETRAACAEALRRSNATIAELGLARALPPCALCSVADAAHAAANSPLACLQLLAHAPAVLARHGPFADAAALFAAVRDGVQSVAAVLEADGRPVVLLGPDGVPRLAAHVVEEGVLPAAAARLVDRALRLVAARAPARAKDGAPLAPDGAPLGIKSSTIAKPGPGPQPARRLLFFREIVAAIDPARDPAPGDAPDPRLAARLAEVFGHRYPGASAPAALERARARAPGGGPSAAIKEGSSSAPGLWGAAPAAAAAREPWPLFVRGTLLAPCAELVELWRVAVRAANGTFCGWRTLTAERAAIEAVPARSLRDAWPRLRPAPPDELPPAVTFTPPGLDAVSDAAARAVAWIFARLGIAPHAAYDLFYAVVRVLEDGLRCDYEAVQTCSRPRVALEHGLVIVAVYVLATYAAFSLLGLGLLVALCAPLFTLALFYLCYGYAWTCAPMLPVCLWSDITAAVAAVLPLSLAVPSQLKKRTPECQGALDADASLCYELLRDGFSTVFDASVPTFAKCYFEQDHPPPHCLLSCRDPPFAYASAADVAAWLVAETGGGAADAARAVADLLARLADTEPFVRALNRREAIFERQPGSSEISAHRICALLSVHMLVPYLFIALLVVAYVAALAAAAATSLFPVFLIVCQLFAAVTTGNGRAPSADDGDSD